MPKGTPMNADQEHTCTAGEKFFGLPASLEESNHRDRERIELV